MSVRCGLCNIPVEAKDFSEHIETLEHKLLLKKSLGYWVKLQIMYKETPKEAIDLVNKIRKENGLLTVGC